jgi:hypothetical protein
MHLTIIKFVVITLASALAAALAMFRYAFQTGESPSDDGPRALVAEFLGYWVGFILLTWSFTVAGKTVQWTLRGVAAFAALAGILLSNHFSDTTEVPETPDKER